MIVVWLENLTTKIKDMNKFIKKMMEIGTWEDRAGSETERNNAIKAAEKLYDKHLAELNLLNIPVVVQQSELLTAFVDWYKERRQYEIPEHSDVAEYLGGL